MRGQRIEQRTEQRIERRVSRRRFVTGTTMALTGASLLAGSDVRALQGEAATQAATPARPLPGATPIGSPVATPGATPVTTSVAGVPRLEVTPSAVAFDERFDIAVYGIAPGQHVTITSRLENVGPPWTATASYVAPEFPSVPGLSYVDPSVMTPVDGMFDVRDTMAFI